MTKAKFRVWLILMGLGIFGILSGLYVEKAIPQKAYITLENILPFLAGKWSFYILFTFLLTISVTIGVNIYSKTGFSMPILEGFAYKKVISYAPDRLIFASLLGSVFIAVSTVLFRKVFEAIDPNLLTEFQEEMVSYKNRLFLRSFTEEIVVCFGFTTLVTWLLQKTLKKETNAIYWTAIITTALISSFIQYYVIIIHLLNSHSTLLFVYLISSKTFIAATFGWLYWKYGIGVSIISRTLLGIFVILLH